MTKVLFMCANKDCQYNGEAEELEFWYHHGMNLEFKCPKCKKRSRWSENDGWSFMEED